ncbi:MAG: Cof-type HAD-IIB family hydrolase [Clostridia bacterium]
MQPSEIRLIVMDMDGTLLNSHQRISDENLQALRQADERGIALAICSGRLCGDISLFAKAAGLNHCAMLSLNGAYCLDKPMGTAYANHAIADAALQACVERLIRLDATFGGFAQNNLAIVASTREHDPVQWGSHAEGAFAPVYSYGVDALERLRPQGVNKLVIVDTDHDRLCELRAELEQVSGVEVTSSWANNLELMPLGVSKGTAVSELANHLGLHAAQVMTFGDYDNDESMIAYAGYGTAMANATECVKRAAKHHTLSNDENGVAVAIRRFALCAGHTRP